MILTLFLTGLAAGIVSSFFGIGGGIIMMPILYSEFPEIPASLAIATSLAVIAISALTNLYIFIKKGLKVHPKIALTLILSMGLSTTIGTELAYMSTGPTLKLILAWTLLLSAVQTLLKSAKSYTQGDYYPSPSPKLFAQLTLACSLSGLIAGLTGLGGGIILIPFFLAVLKMPLRYVPLYSNIGMLAGTSLTFLLNLFRQPLEPLHLGVYTNDILPFQFGLNNFALIFLLYSGSFLGSKFGVKSLSKISDSQGKYLFAALQLFFSLRLFIKNW